MTTATDKAAQVEELDHIMIYPTKKEQVYLRARAAKENSTPADIALLCIIERAAGGVVAAPAASAGQPVSADIDIEEFKAAALADFVDWLSNQYHDATAGKLHVILKHYRDGKPMPRPE